MKSKIPLLFWLIVTQLYSHTSTITDSLVVKNNVENITKNTIAVKELFHFPELDKKFPLHQKKSVAILPEFTFPNIRNEYPASSELINEGKQEAKAGFEEIEKSGKWITSFSNENIQTLPVGIKHQLNEVEYQIAFTKARFNKKYTELTVFVRISLPQTKEDGTPIELFFGANNVKLSHQGGIIGDANLVLLGDIFIPFNAGNWLLTLKGGFDYQTGDTRNRTYVTIGCDGVKKMGIEGEVQFSRNLILPVDNQGKLLPETRNYKTADQKNIQIPNRVTGAFRADISDWNDLLVEINLSPFVLANQPDKFIFFVQQAIFDFSDIRTDNVYFPKHYYDNGLLIPSVESWRGVYIASLQIGLPEEFKTKESISQNKRLFFEAADLLIDEHGVSGYFTAENIIPLKSGRTSDSKAWAYSVDKISIELASNQLIGADFNGQILLPISDKGEQNKNEKLGLGYQGIITEEEYTLAVSTVETLRFDVFQAKAELFPNSTIELSVIDGNFRPKAILNGRMAISASQKESLQNEGQPYTEKEEDTNIVQFKGIEFQNLVLQTTSPAIKVDYLGYKDEIKLAGFPVSIADIAFISNEYESGIEFDIKVNLMDKGFAGSTRIGVYGKLYEEQYKQRWKYDRLGIDEIFLDADMGAVQLKGLLVLMDNDPVYGNGFSAELQGTFGSFGPLTCKAIFGKKEYRYWYVDAAIHGLKLQVGPMQISGFAGGAYYRMNRRANAGSQFSPSGLSYIPNNTTGLGVKAMVFGAIGDESAIAIGAGFEIEFNTRGGVNRLGLFGEAQVMKAFDYPNPVGKLKDKLSTMADNEKLNGIMNSSTGKTFLDKATEEYEPEIVGEAAISAKMGMQFDFVNDTFHADLDLYVSVAGGVIQGRASRGRAGWGVVHISPDQWYVHMGTPTDRLGLKMGIGSFSVETGGYFMVGDRIPGSPPPPPEVAQILGVEAESLNYMRDENALGEGRGFAFGTDFKIDTGDMHFLILYARFQAGVGFDIMVKNYGNARCVNTGDEVGINGWYANGQSYAYLQGELGIKIKLFFIKKKIPIIKGGAAILMQAKGPNPFWMKGYAAGYYDLLGGLVKGSYRFKITIGEECVFENGAPIGGIKIITDLTPKDGENNIDVFAAPQAAFAMRVNQPVVIPEDDGDKTYKIILEKCEITDATGKKIEGKLEWGYMNDRVTFMSEDILPPKTKLKVTVEVSFQEKINGVFNTIIEDGKKVVEIEERNFTTGTAPDHIPLHNIKYAYPVVDQTQFYRNEYNTGYIQLRRGQDYLFDNTQWKSTVNYIDENGNTDTSAFNYSTADNKVSYSLPKVKKTTKYNMSIVSAPKSKSSTTATESTTKVNNYGENNTMEVRQNKAQNVLKDGEIERLTYAFKTSKHKTFADKIKDINVTDHSVGKINSDVIFLFNQVASYDGFSILELKGSKYSENIPLVSQEAILSDTYFNQDINPVIYSNYPFGGNYHIVSRKTKLLGIPPRRALPIESDYLTSLENNTNTNIIQTHFPYMYNLPRVYKEDFIDLRDQAYRDLTSGKITIQHPIMKLAQADYFFMRYGKYEVKLQYILPGGIKGSSSKVDYKNPLKFR